MDTDCGALYFKDQTKIYRLHVQFQKNSLKVQLEDFVDWVVYSGKFSDQDIGKSIDKRLELSDIYDAFILARNQELAMKDEQIQSCSVRSYEYGQVVKCGQIPCFKIEKGGKIVIYVSLTKSTTKKLFQCQSILSLSKKNNMSETHIITQKSMSQMRQQRDFFYKLVNKMKVQFTQQLTQLKEQNQVLKQKKKNMEEKITQISQFYQSKTQGLIRQNQILNNSINQLVNQVKDFRKSSEERYFYLRNSLYLHPLQPYITKFKVSFNVIQMIADNGSWTHLFFNQTIGFNQQYKFKVKVVKTASKNIMIGVADEPKQINSRTSYSSNNAVSYYGANGYKYPNGGNEGTGFGSGDTIQTIVDRTNKTIKWSVSGVTQATFVSDIIGDKTRVLRPYFQMYNVNDIVEIIFDSFI